MLLIKKKSIKDIKNILFSENVDQVFIDQLKNDDRKGIQKLLLTYERHQQKERQLASKFLQMSQYESKCYAQGKTYIAGVDEAGRGPLAGPVVAAAVILPKDFKLFGLTDSKQLSEKQRTYFYEKIKTEAIDYHISMIHSEEIDQINIFEATKKAMQMAIRNLSKQADHVLIDAVTLHGLPCTSDVIIKGDQQSISIAAASVLAKVTRDHLMHEIHQQYPAYHFNSNMGYGTKQHLEALMKYGITPYHRKTFSPVKQAMNL